MSNSLQLIQFKQINYKHITLCLVLFVCQKINATNYYVNDSLTKGDIFTTTIGNDTNDGLTPNTPKLTLSEVYKLAKEGDTVYVDTGNYSAINDLGQLLFDNFKNIKFIISGKENVILPKTPLPSNEKVSPTDFYIIDDKPVDREAYLLRLQNTSKKSKAK